MDRINYFLALDVATDPVDDVFGMEFEQGWEAREARRAAEQTAGAPDRLAITRRLLAQGLAAVSRGTAAAVRRLDAVVADDLGRELAPRK